MKRSGLSIFLFAAVLFWFNKSYGSVIADTTQIPHAEIGLYANSGIHERKIDQSIFIRRKIKPGKKKISEAILFRLACLSARLRLYPLAMQCFIKSQILHNHPGYSFVPSDLDEIEDSLVNGGPARFYPSEPEDRIKIIHAFTDSVFADGYALVLHIKQPRFRKRKAFTGINNVGHTFITLIEFNGDQTYICRSFGFYPRKTHLLSATPLEPVAKGIFKDDAGHDWDEMVGKFISRDRFLKILQAVEAFSHRKYNLNRNNCTDFGLYVARLGGIQINQTCGKWPLGRGNNPACAGQSILDGNLINTDTKNCDSLFICINQKMN